MLVALVNVCPAWTTVMIEDRETPRVHKYKETINNSYYDGCCTLRSFRSEPYEI